MILEPFQYFSPQNMDDLFDILTKYGDDAKIIAGGQSLIPIMKMGSEIPVIVDIKKISGLSGISEVKDEGDSVGELRIGALATHSQVERSEVVRKSVPLLSRTAAGIGHPLIRNRGTIGGSLSHCDPAGDLCAATLALDASVMISAPGGRERKVPVKDFFLGPLTTDLKNGEIVTEVVVPVPSSRTGYDVQKLTLGHGDFPLFIAAVSIAYRDNRFTEAAIGLGGVADTAVRAHECEDMINGRETLGPDDIQSICRLAMDTYDPPQSLELSTGYTRKMVGAYLGKALQNALNRLLG